MDLSPDPSESPDPDEPALAQHLADAIRTIVQQQYDRAQPSDPDGKTAFRDAHAKIVGLVRATVTVRADLPSDLAHGVWKAGSVYKAWVRYSNGEGQPQSDGAKDARGMAIKLCALPSDLGERLPGDTESHTQDFVMIDHPNFFIRDARQYVDFVDRKVAGKSVLGFVFPSVLPWNWRLRSLCIMLALQKDPRSHLAQTYHSMTPYRLGPHIVKLRCRPLHDVAARADEAYDSLRAALAAQLASGDARFALEVQRRNDESLSIEDARQRWPENSAPFEQVAEVVIPQQTFATPEQLAFGNRLSFSPWHGHLAHRPLGSLNRVRRLVYPASSTLRHSLNATPPLEPTGDETF
ncbi:MAG TPA: hypothetical protein VL463_21275 [Kofleriaceae bacterium]|jgi:hypothetical protein|nr:hypothetical protein [Kofleriaceae bacterium]